MTVIKDIDYLKTHGNVTELDEDWMYVNYKDMNLIVTYHGDLYKFTIADDIAIVFCRNPYTAIASITWDVPIHEDPIHDVYEFVKELPKVWIAKLMHPKFAKEYYEQLDAIGMDYSTWSNVWFWDADEKPDAVIQDVEFVRYPEEIIIPNDNYLGTLAWVACGDTYNKRGVLKRYGFKWTGKVWCKISYGEPESIEGVTFIRDVV